LLALDSCLIVLLNVALAKCKSTRVFIGSLVPIVINPVGLPTAPNVIHVPLFGLVVPFKDNVVPVKDKPLLAVIFAALVFVIRISFVVVKPFVV